MAMRDILVEEGGRALDRVRYYRGGVGNRWERLQMLGRTRKKEYEGGEAKRECEG